MTYKLPLAAGVAAGLALAAIVPSSHGWATTTFDEKQYPGYLCQEQGSESGAFDRSEYRITRKTSAGSGTLLCPAIKDDIDSGHVYANWYVTDTNMNPDSWVSCALSLRNWSGSQIRYDSDRTYGAPGADELHADFLTDGIDGPYAIACWMAPNSSAGYFKLKTYEVLE